MENSKKIVILLITTIVMVGGMFWGIQFNQKSNPTSGQAVSGTAEFKGTIRIYDPILLVSTNIPDSLLTKLRNDERIKAVSDYSGGYLLNISTREDVYPLADFLRSNGIHPQGVANIVLPNFLIVKTGNGTILNASTHRIGSVKAMMEPLIDIDNEVPVNMIAVVLDNELVDYGNPVVNSSKVTIPLNATIVSLNGKRYDYIIPWKDRNDLDIQSLKADYGDDNVNFTKAGYISFPNRLTVSQITEKKNLSYLTYISDTGASVEENFTDMERISSDFLNITVVFPDSAISITSNKTVDLKYNGSVVYSYYVLLPSNVDRYSIRSEEIPLNLHEELPVNQSVEVNITGIAIGNNIVSILGVEQG